MTENKKKGLLSKLFGKKTDCCCIQLEEVDEHPEAESVEKRDRSKGGCCSTHEGHRKRDTDH